MRLNEVLNPKKEISKNDQGFLAENESQQAEIEQKADMERLRTAG